MGEENTLRAAGGFCAPVDMATAAKLIAKGFDVPYELLFHCDLCARYPVRFWNPSQEVFYVIFEQEQGVRRLISRLLRQPTSWHRIEFFPKTRLRDVLPAFTAVRGGITY